MTYRVAIRDACIEESGIHAAVEAAGLSEAASDELLGTVLRAVGSAVRYTELLSRQGKPSDILTAYLAGVALGETEGYERGLQEGMLRGLEDGYFEAMQQVRQGSSSE